MPELSDCAVPEPSREEPRHGEDERHQLTVSSRCLQLRAVLAHQTSGVLDVWDELRRAGVINCVFPQVFMVTTLAFIHV